jgi:hypothetical protein
MRWEIASDGVNTTYGGDLQSADYDILAFSGDDLELNRRLRV